MNLESTKKVLATIFAADRPQGQQINQFNHFIDVELPRIIGYYSGVIDTTNVVTTPQKRFSVQLGSVFVGKPCFPEIESLKHGVQGLRMLTPHIARETSMTYASPMCVYATLTERLLNTETDSEPKVIDEGWITLGYIPIMVGSNRCHTFGLSKQELIDMRHEAYGDTGGYFITSGGEKVMIAQEKMAYNHVMIQQISNKLKGKYQRLAEIRCVPVGGRLGSRTSNVSIMIYIPSTVDKLVMGHVSKTLAVRVCLPQMLQKTDMPIVILLHALGITNDKAVVEFMGHEAPISIVKSSMMEAEAAYLLMEDKYKGIFKNIRGLGCLQEDALVYIGKMILKSQAATALRSKCIIRATEMLGSEFFCHIGTDFSDEVNEKKIQFLAHMMSKLWAHNLNSRDHIGVKRLETINSFMCSLLQSGMEKVTGDVIKHLTKAADNHHFSMSLSRLFAAAPRHMNPTFRVAIATGRWGDKQTLINYNVPVRHGITQTANRFTAFTLASQLRKTNIQAGRDSNVSAPRDLHASQYGFFDCSETPEGQQCGLIKTLTACARISIGCTKERFTGLLDYLFTWDEGLQNKNAKTLIMANGVIAGRTSVPKQLVSHLRHLRRSGQRIIDWSTGIVLSLAEDVIHINLDEGRVLRPLLIASAARSDTDKIAEIYNLHPYSEKERLRVLLEEGIIEFIGADEVSNSLIATSIEKARENSEYTHVELHPSTIFGMSALDIPFSNMNQSVRNSYQCVAHTEEILMGDGSVKAIGDVQIGDKVLAFSTTSLRVEETTVIAQWVKPTEKELVRVTTKTGCELVTTVDHKFFTDEGWVEARSLIGKRAAIFHRHCQVPRELLGVMQATGDAVFVEIATLQKVTNVLVADITVAHSDSNFISASGYGVHNCSMGKQAISMHNYMINRRIDSTAHFLHYPQRPICNASRWMLKEEEYMSGGTNVVLAVMSQFYNQEDSLIINQSSIDRGLFTSSVLKTATDVRRPNEELKIPDATNTSHLRKANYDHLEPDGLAAPGDHLKGNDVYIGQVVTKKNGAERDISNILKTSALHADQGQIDSVILGGNPINDYKFVKTRLRATKIPEIGDKFSSRHGQKGVVGIALRQEDMPFDKNGVTPDLVLNSHAIPSRMTVGHLMEMAVGKVGAIQGKIFDTPSFEKVQVTGFTNEVMYNPFTGRKYQARVYTGVIKYQKLKHMVSDKQHVRSQGRHEILTRQPVEGRSREGGLRMGEMERDAIVAHGCGAFLQDRLMYSSDPFEAPICGNCGILARSVTSQCRVCKENSKVQLVLMPYAAKLLLTELMAMNIVLKLKE